MRKQGSKQIPENGHVVEMRKERYGYTLSHRFNNHVVYIGTYPNRMELKRSAMRILEREEAEGHEVTLICDPGLN